MPRAASVTIEEALAVVEQFMPYFTTNQIPSSSSKVWREMSKALNGKWSPQAVNINVRQNRRQVLSIARKNMGIDLPVIRPKPKYKKDPDFSDEDYTDDVKRDDGYLDNFDLIISKDQWDKLRESVEYIDNDYVLLNKSVWSEVLSLACYKHVNKTLSSAHSSKNSEKQPE